MKILSINIILLLFLNVISSYNLFGKNAKKEIVVNVSNMINVEKAIFSRICLYIDDDNVSWNNVLRYLIKINLIGLKEISICKNDKIIDISSNGIENDIKVSRPSFDKKIRNDFKNKNFIIKSINHSRGNYILIYWPINAWRNDWIRKIDIMLFKRKIDSLRDKKIGLNFYIDKTVSVGDVFCYLSVLAPYRNCVGIVFSYDSLFNPEYYQLSPNISTELP